MRSLIGCLAGGLLLVGCGHTQTTGSAANGWVTPTGYASATHPTNLNSSSGATVNSAARHGDSYDSRFNTAANAPSDFGRLPPPVMQSSAPPDTSLAPLAEPPNYDNVVPPPTTGTMPQDDQAAPDSLDSEGRAPVPPIEP